MCRGRTTRLLEVDRRGRRTRSRPRGAPPATRSGRSARSVDEPHAAPAAAVRGLHEHGHAEILGERSATSASSSSRSVALSTGSPAAIAAAPRADLVAHPLEHLRGRADERDVALGAGGAESRVLGEEPVAGIDGVRADGSPCRR